MSRMSRTSTAKALLTAEARDAAAIEVEIGVVIAAEIAAGVADVREAVVAGADAGDVTEAVVDGMAAGVVGAVTKPFSPRIGTDWKRAATLSWLFFFGSKDYVVDGHKWRESSVPAGDGTETLDISRSFQCVGGAPTRQPMGRRRYIHGAALPL